MDPRVAQLPQNRGKPKAKQCLCPFGCQTGKNTDQNGYCRHLVGWTLNNHEIEVREQHGHLERTGHLLDLVQPADVIVPMATDSSRVYRIDGKFPFGCPEESLTPAPVAVPLQARGGRPTDNEALYETIIAQGEALKDMERKIRELEDDRRGRYIDPAAREAQAGELERLARVNANAPSV